MQVQKFLAPYSLEQVGKVILLEAEPGRKRRDSLDQWLQDAYQNGANTWLLSCDWNEDGPWAGVNQWLTDVVPKIQAYAPDLVAKHDYELVHVLPTLRKIMPVRHISLTDAASEENQVRNHPADRVVRIIHGVIDLLDKWQQHSARVSWVIACDRYDYAGVLVRQFFSELMRRRGQEMNLTLLIATDVGASDAIATEFALEEQIQRVELNLGYEPIAPHCEQAMFKLAQELETQIGEDDFELESHLPKLIHYLLLSGQTQKALDYQIRACSIYRKRGYYNDALAYGEFALAQLGNDHQKDKLKFWKLVKSMYVCYNTFDQPMQILPLLEEVMNTLTTPDDLSRCCYLIAILYARYFPSCDYAKAEMYLNQGFEILSENELPEDVKLLRSASLNRGLALIRLRQGRPREAIELAQFSYNQLRSHLEPDQHLLNKSVLLNVIARVHAALGAYDEAISYLSDAIEMDPNYSEYYNDRGNLYFKKGCFVEAASNYINAIKTSPSYSEVWVNLGHCYRQLKYIDKAIEAYSNALDLLPGQSPVLLARAQTFEMLGQVSAALKDYDTALSINPNQPLVLANRAILHYEAKCYQEALDDLNKAISLASENSDLYQNRAIALIALDRFEEAVQDLVSYLRLNPNASDRSEVEERLLSLQNSN